MICIRGRKIVGFLWSGIINSFSAVSPKRCPQMNASAPSSILWNKDESLTLLNVPFLKFLTFYRGVMFNDDDCNGPKFQDMRASRFVALTLYALF